MTVRVRLGLTLGLSATNAEEKNLGNLSHEVLTDLLGEGFTQKVRLPSGAVDQVLPCPSVASGKVLFVRTSPRDPAADPATVNLKINGGAEVVPVVPLVGTKEGFLVVTHTGITALTASNPGAVDMDLVVAMGGD